MLHTGPETDVPQLVPGAGCPGRKRTLSWVFDGVVRDREARAGALLNAAFRPVPSFRLHILVI
ncbi:hypothetical protein ACFQ2B_20965 [Streptomyces stramineus]|uniref:Uncharacterized protein n=1 Tax=Streptomyces stramineus TaxID=173861 RepID=A0ABN1AE57_9ACTN